MDGMDHLLMVSVEGLPCYVLDTDLFGVGRSHGTVDGVDLPCALLHALGLHVDFGHPVQGVLRVGELSAAVLHHSRKGSVLPPDELLKPGVEEDITQLGGAHLLGPPGVWLLTLLVLDVVLRWITTLVLAWS